MKENIKLCLFAAALIFFGAFPVSALCSTLSGPETVKPGELASIECDETGEWIITPTKGVQFAKDSNGQKIYIVGQKEGEYTVIFFGVVKGNPLLLQKDITIGTPEPEPEPEPSPSPSPSPAPVVKNLNAEDRAALAASLTFTIQSIETGRIRTVQGARSTFKQSITSRASVCDGTSCHLKKEVSEVLDAWTDESDFSTLESTKESFQKFLKEVQ